MLTHIGLIWKKREEQKTTSLPAHTVLSSSIKGQDLVKAPFRRGSLGLYLNDFGGKGTCLWLERYRSAISFFFESFITS